MVVSAYPRERAAFVERQLAAENPFQSPDFQFFWHRRPWQEDCYWADASTKAAALLTSSNEGGFTMANWDNGQVSPLTTGQTLTCTTLSQGQLYGIFLYNAAGNDNNATIFVTVGNKQPKAVTVPGTTAGQGLASIVLVSGNDSDTVSIAMADQSNAQIQCWIGSVSMPTGATSQPLPDDGQTLTFAQQDRYYAVPPSSWQALTIASSITQFISVQFQEYFATIYIVNPLPGAQAAVYTTGSVSSSDYSVVLASNPASSIVQTFAGDGTQWVWMNADSSQDSSDATISLQPLSVQSMMSLPELPERPTA